MGNKPAITVAIGKASVDRSIRSAGRNPGVDPSLGADPSPEVSWVGGRGYLTPLERGFYWIPNYISE